MDTSVCQNCKQNFTIEPDDLSFYKKMQVPPPTFCSLCRMQRRMAFRNERKLFKVKDAFTGESLFSLYPPEAKRKIITQEEWHGDSWSAFDYGRDIDWSRPFIPQIFAIEKEVPIYNLCVKLMQNSPYSGNATGLKNCYLCFNSSYSENSQYGSAIDFCTDCVDNSQIHNCERCYESFWLEKCYQCYFSIMCVDSRNMWFSRDCIGCNDCFGCTNLRKQSHCIFNEQFTKEDYEKKIAEMNLDSISGVVFAREKARAFWKTQINKYHQGLKNQNCTGSYVSNSKNVQDSWMVLESENMRFCQNMLIPGNKDCYDTNTWGENTQLSYETIATGENSYNMKFSYNCWPNCRDSEYCMNMFSSSNCFGCVGMTNAQFCILNKQYTKEQYEKLVPKIKEHMDAMPYIDKQKLQYTYGEFFPIEFSPFGYNNTMAQEHVPLREDETRYLGYAWVGPERGKHKATIFANNLPDSIIDVPNSILKEIIECVHCKLPYRIIPDELTFLRKEGLPLPRACIDCRHGMRLDDRLPTPLYERTCMCAGESDETNQYKNTVAHNHGASHCQNQFKTGYDPETSSAIVYCEECYQQEVA